MRYVLSILLLLPVLTALAQSPGSSCETAIDAAEPGFVFKELPEGSRTWYKFSSSALKCVLNIPAGNSFVLYEHEGDNFCGSLNEKPAQTKMLAKRNITADNAGMQLPSFSEETLNGKCDCNSCTGGMFNEELKLKPGSQYYILLIGKGKGAKLEFITNNDKSAGKTMNTTAAAMSNKDPKNLDPIQRFINQKQLDQLEVGESIMLKTVRFEHRGTKLMEESAPDLERLCKFMKSNPKVKIEVQGHVDGSGKASANNEEEKYALKLSEGRAKAVKDYLVSNGIPESRISYKGYGTSGMVYFGNLEDYIKYNRRVEAKIIEK